MIQASFTLFYTVEMTKKYPTLQQEGLCLQVMMSDTVKSYFR